MATPNIIPSIFTAVDKVSGPMMAMTRNVRQLRGEFQTLNTVTDNTAMMFSRIGHGATQLGASMVLLGGAIVAPFALSARAAMNFHEQMGNVGTLIDTTRESLDDMGDNVLKLSKKIPKPIEDLSLALYQVRSDGIKAGNGINEAFGVLESSGKLATAGLSTTAEAAKTVTSALNVFSDAGLNSEQVANSMFKTIQNGKTNMSELGQAFGKNAAIIHSAGVSMFEMNAATAAITATGITAAQSQNELGAAVLALMKPTGNLETIFESLGYAGEGGFKRLIKTAGGLVPAMEAINAQAKVMGITMSEDFGRKEALVANILLTGERNKAYYENLAIQMNGENTLNGKFGDQAATAAKQFQLFKSAVERLAIRVGDLLLPVLNKMFKIIEPVIDAVADFAHNHKLLAGVIANSAAALGTFLLVAGTAALIFGGVAKAVGLMNTAFWTYKALVKLAAGESIVLNGALFSMPKLAAFAAQGIWGMNGALAAAAKNAAVLLALFQAIGLVTDMYDNQKKYNPLRFNEGQDANSKKNKAIREKYGISEDDFNKAQTLYHLKLDKGIADDLHLPNMLRSKRLENHEATEPVDTTKGQDSLGIYQFRQNLSEDTTGRYSQSAPVSFGGGVPGGAQIGAQDHTFTINIENNSGFPVGATATGGDAAGKVAINVVSTRSRAKTRDA